MDWQNKIKYSFKSKLKKTTHTNDKLINQNQINMEFLESFARKYGGVVIAGVVGAIIRRIRENMTLIEFLQVIFLGVFVSYCVGVTVEEYLDITEHFKYVIGAVSAIYSKEVLDTQRKLEDDTFWNF